MQKILETLSLRGIAWAAVGWLCLFWLIYGVIPCLPGGLGRLHGSICNIDSVGLSLYTSVITMFSLGYSDVYPLGWLRTAAAIEVIGGEVLIGFAIASIVAFPSSHTRRATRACKGHWLECIDLPNGRRFYSFTWMFPDGQLLIKGGRNFDPGGPMHKTQYSGQLVTGYFPTLMSIYKNDELSTDFTEGVLMFQVQMDSTGAYRSYLGGTIDAKHGKRDRISGRRIDNLEFIKKFEDNLATDQDLMQMIERLYGAYPPVAKPESPPLPPAAATVVMHAQKE